MEEDESWVTFNLSVSDQHRLEPHLISWKPSAEAKDAPASDELYDPKADENDEAWIEKKYGEKRRATDAVLSCAGCFSVVCFVCRRFISQGKFFYKGSQAIKCRVVPHGDSSSHPERQRVSDLTVETPCRRRRCASVAQLDLRLTKRLRLLDANSIRNDEDDAQGWTATPLSEENISPEAAADSEDEMMDAHQATESGTIQCLSCGNCIGHYDRNKALYTFVDVLPSY